MHTSASSEARLRVVSAARRAAEVHQKMAAVLSACLRALEEDLLRAVEMEGAMVIPLERCRSCNEAVRWVVTVAGKRMPLDPDMCPDGNVVFTHPEREDGAVRALTAAEVAGEATRPRYKSHFATCPQSRTWRKGWVQKAVARARARAERLP